MFKTTTTFCTKDSNGKTGINSSSCVSSEWGVLEKYIKCPFRRHKQQWMKLLTLFEALTTGQRNIII